MREWLRRFRGTLRAGVLWGLGGGVMAALGGAIVAIATGQPVLGAMISAAVWIVPWTFVLGTCFATAVVALGGSRGFEELTASRFAAFGAIGGVGLAGLLIAANGPGTFGLWATLVSAGTFALVGAGMAAGSFALARRAPPELEDGRGAGTLPPGDDEPPV